MQPPFTWLWWWLPLRFWKRQSSATVLFRTTLAKATTLYELLILLKYNFPGSSNITFPFGLICFVFLFHLLLHRQYCQKVKQKSRTSLFCVKNSSFAFDDLIILVYDVHNCCELRRRWEVLHDKSRLWWVKGSKNAQQLSILIVVIVIIWAKRCLVYRHYEESDVRVGGVAIPIQCNTTISCAVYGYVPEGRWRLS